MRILGQPCGASHHVVVIEDPHRRGACRAQAQQRLIDSGPKFRHVPAGLEEPKVEHERKLIRPPVQRLIVTGSPDFPHSRSIGGVLVQYLTKSAPHLMGAGVRFVLEKLVALRLIGSGDVLGQVIGYVHPEPIHATVEPEPPYSLKLCQDFGILPVQVWLLAGE